MVFLPEMANSKQMAKIDQNGRVLIPATYRSALGLRPNDHVILLLEDGEVLLLTPKRAVERAQELVRRHISEGRALSDELLTERREETGGG